MWRIQGQSETEYLFFRTFHSGAVDRIKLVGIIISHVNWFVGFSLNETWNSNLKLQKAKEETFSKKLWLGDCATENPGYLLSLNKISDFFKENINLFFFSYHGTKNSILIDYRFSKISQQGSWANHFNRLFAFQIP